MNALSVKLAYYLKHVCDVQIFHLQEVCARDRYCILPRMKKSMALFYIKNFSCHVTLLLKRKLQHVGHKWVIAMWVTSGLFSGSNGSTDVTHFQP